MLIPLSKIKHHLNIPVDYTGDDEYLLDLIRAAEEAVSLRIDRPLSDCINSEGYLHPSIEHAVKLLVGQFYNNREAASALQMREVPLAFDLLVNINKHYSFV